MVLLTFVACSLHLTLYSAGRFLLIPFTTLTTSGNRLYADPAIPADVRVTLERETVRARQRVKALFGDVRSRPLIVAVSSPRYARLFGGSLTGTGLTHLSVVGSWILLSPRGFNADVIAHEWTHAEMRARVRTVRYEAIIPLWFNEGVAMQNDWRPEYSRRAFDRRLQSDAPIRLSDIATPEGFREHRALAYMTAKFEIERWISITHQKGLVALLDGLSSREEFETRYATPPSGS
ncbi:MAG TPA: hypothetical protein VGK32_07050 [Vicinamibacterales bacterium]